MSLLIILLIGANLGWLTSIARRVDRPGEVIGNVVLGVLGSFVFGAMASSISLLEGVTPGSLVASAVGALATLGLAWLVARPAMPERRHFPRDRRAR